jgi:hypothetical protein
MLNTVSTRDLQRTPKKVIREANRSKRPLIVISENIPQAAIISIDLLDRFLKYIPEESPYDMMKLNKLALEALEASRKGETRIIKTKKELEKYIKEIEKMEVDVKKAQLARAKSKSELDRMRRLFEQKAVSDKDVDDAKNAYDAAALSVKNFVRSCALRNAIKAFSTSC